MPRFTPTLVAALVGAAMLSSCPRVRAGDPGRCFPPSYYGYPLDDFTAGYYGGSRYREYYSYGRGFGVADMPGPVPGPIEPYVFKRPFWDHKGQAPETVIVPAVPVVVAPPKTCALLDVRVPENAEVWLEGNPTNQTGPRRQYVSPELKPDHPYVYRVKARWKADGRDVEETQMLSVKAGDRLQVAFPIGQTVAAPVTPNRLPRALSGR